MPGFRELSCLTELTLVELDFGQVTSAIALIVAFSVFNQLINQSLCFDHKCLEVTKTVPFLGVCFFYKNLGTFVSYRVITTFVLISLKSTRLLMVF